MDRVRKNLVANFISSGWIPIIGTLSLPFYVRFMGLEAYALVSMFMILQSVVLPLDAGLSMTLGRELARLSVLPNSAQEMRNLLRTLESIFWVLAAFIGIVVAAAAPLLAHFWVNAEVLDPTTITQAFILMGVAVGLQFPFALYQGGLMGIQRQVSLATINVTMFTLRFGGAVIVLWLVSRTVQSFFIYQAIISLCHTAAVAIWLWRRLPKAGSKAVFRWQLLKSIRYFAAGVGGISVTSLILTQFDKLVVISMFPLETYAYYAIAATMAAGMYRLFAPVFVALQPRFTQLVSLDKKEELARLYHRACQLISVLVFPIAAVLTLFSREVLDILEPWMDEPQVAEKGWVIMAALVAANTLNGIAILPYAMQLAFGWTKLPLLWSASAVVILVPTTIALAAWFGPVGAAIALLVPMIGQLLVTIPIMHSRVLKNEMWRWYLADTGLPLLAAVAVALLGRAVFEPGAWWPVTLVRILAVLAASFAAAALASGEIRSWLARAWNVGRGA